MAAAAARWNHVWVGTDTGILKGGGRGREPGAGVAVWGHWRD